MVALHVVLVSAVQQNESTIEKKVLVTQSCPTLYDSWTVAYQAPLSMEFSWQEYWSG